MRSEHAAALGLGLTFFAAGVAQWYHGPYSMVAFSIYLLTAFAIFGTMVLLANSSRG